MLSSEHAAVLMRRCTGSGLRGRTADTPAALHLPAQLQHLLDVLGLGEGQVLLQRVEDAVHDALCLVDLMRQRRDRGGGGGYARWQGNKYPCPSLFMRLR